MKDTIVIDDVSPGLEAHIRKTVLDSAHWSFIKDMSYANYEQEYPSYGFNLMIKHPTWGIKSPSIFATCGLIIEDLCKKTGIDLPPIYYNRAFLQIPLDSKFVKQNNGVHIDLPEDHWAAVYYLNDADGDTIIYEQTADDVPTGSQNIKLTEHKRVTPKAGRIVLFDGRRYHCSSQPRNSYRAIINFDLV